MPSCRAMRRVRTLVVPLNVGDLDLWARDVLLGERVALQALPEARLAGIAVALDDNLHCKGPKEGRMRRDDGMRQARGRTVVLNATLEAALRTLLHFVDALGSRLREA